MSGIHNFLGSSGTWYRFNMIPFQQTFASAKGVYMFARSLADGNYEVLYVGKASDLAKRATRLHERFADALSSGMTHIGATICNTDEFCDRVERDLIALFCPRLNKHHNYLASLLK